MFEKKICTYSPPAHGFETGSDNGNYAEYTNFRYRDGKFYIKYTSSGDGDMFPYSAYEEVTPEEFFDNYGKAAVDAYLEKQEWDARMEVEKESSE